MFYEHVRLPLEDSVISKIQESGNKESDTSVSWGVDIAVNLEMYLVAPGVLFLLAFALTPMRGFHRFNI